MADVNTAFRVRSEAIHKSYKNGLIHGYAPRGFFISYDRAEKHLEIETGQVILDVPTLLKDFVAAVGGFAKNLHVDSAERPGHGTVEAMANALTELIDHR